MNANRRYVSPSPSPSPPENSPFDLLTRRGNSNAWGEAGASRAVGSTADHAGQDGGLWELALTPVFLLLP